MVKTISDIFNKQESILSKIVFLLKRYLLPICLSAVIVFTSGYAYSTSRENASFNPTILYILAGLTVLMVVFALLKIPFGFYKRLAHPIKNGVVKETRFYLVAIMLLLMLLFPIIYLIKGNDIFTIVHYLLLALFGVSLTIIVPFKSFVRYFNKTLMFIAIFSLIAYIFTIGNFATGYYSASFTNVNGVVYQSLLGIFFQPANSVARNCGPFWEPGIYALFLIFGIAFELLFEDKPSWITVGIFVVCTISTLSTSGLILMFFLIPLYFLKTNKLKWLLITLGIALGLSGIFLLLGSPLLKVPFFSDIFSKLFTESSGGSFDTRLKSPIIGFYLFAKSFGLGYGPNKFDALYKTTLILGLTKPIAQTSTLGWLSGSYGILGLAFCILSLSSLFIIIKRKINIKTAIFALVYMLIIINCEPMYSFSIFWVISLYPITGLIKQRVASVSSSGSLELTIKKSNVGTKLTIENHVGSLVVKVLALLIGLALYPLYIKYFGNHTTFIDFNGESTTHGTVTLGLWLVILQILSWILTFDIGIGNGLKNKLVEALNRNDRVEAKKLITCSYISNGAIVILLLAVGLPVIFNINFSSLLHISEEVIPLHTLQLSFALAFISIALEFFLKIVLNIYQALQKQIIASTTTLISTILLLIFTSAVRIESMSTALIAISSFYIFSVNLPLIVLTIIMFSKRFKDCFPSFKEFSFKTAKSVISLGGIYFLIQIFLLVINSTNKALISNIYGAAAVPGYEPYLKIFSAICAIASAISLPLWTLTVRADVRNDINWIKKTKKVTFVIVGIFIFGSLLAAGILQFIFDFWLGSNSFDVDYGKAFIFAGWAIMSICVYFTSAFSNGFKILKPQLLVFGIAAVVKVPLFLLIHKLLPNIDWIMLVVFDAVAMAAGAITMYILNDRAIAKRCALATRENNN